MSKSAGPCSNCSARRVTIGPRSESSWSRLCSRDKKDCSFEEYTINSFDYAIAATGIAIPQLREQLSKGHWKVSTAKQPEFILQRPVLPPYPRADVEWVPCIRRE